jgi:hypothetical protein
MYSGTLGKVGNCQIGVSVHAATDWASAALDWRLPADKLFRHISRIVEGWALYFRHGSASRAFGVASHYLWW